MTSHFVNDLLARRTAVKTALAFALGLQAGAADSRSPERRTGTEMWNRWDLRCGVQSMARANVASAIAPVNSVGGERCRRVAQICYNPRFGRLSGP